MAKKGATQDGGTAGRKRAKDQAMAAMLPPSPESWNKGDILEPNNKGVVHLKPGSRRGQWVRR